MTALKTITAEGRRAADHHPWPRVAVDASGWQRAIESLVAEEWSLLGLWGEPRMVHMAVMQGTDVVVLSLDCADDSFPSVGARHAPAIRLERTITDLFGLTPEGAQDRRPWLDHGRWGVTHPLGGTSTNAAGESALPSPRGEGWGESARPSPPYAFLPAEGEALHQIPVGPVHAGIIEPGHFRFTAAGETVVRLEERLGYVHKGIEGLMAGADLARAARLAGRTSGDSTVAYAFAFARAVEAATGTEAPPRARWLRALMAELERLANHLGDIGAICNDAAFSIMLAHCGVLRERVLRFADAAFGHRLMMDRVIPGGVAIDLADARKADLRTLLAEIRATFPRLVQIYDNTASLLDRTVSTGILKPALARRFAAGGFVGRASGRNFDTRRVLPYPPYDELTFEVPVREKGDVDARVWIRIDEVNASLALIDQIVARLPDGPVITNIPHRAGEGLAIVEGFRGDILVSVRLGADGRVERCHFRDPSWFQWPLLEAAIEGNIVADFPLCNKSFNCSYSGHDL